MYRKENACGPNQIKEYQLGFPRPVLIVETGEAFASVTACARHIGGFSSAIHNVLSGRRRTHKGFTFKALTDKEYKVYRSA